MLTPYQIAKNTNALTGRANTIAINRLYRAQDESHLYPIRNRFDATERAIKRARQIMADCGAPCEGLEYALTIDSALSLIVNSEV
jgi:hypothetical protein